jgi:diguanylate cyclase (GGDEF)-like protein
MTLSPESPTSTRRSGSSNFESRDPSTFPSRCFDLDGFKQTNDRYGHSAGDALLKQFAAELRMFLRSTDIVSRWGGDEFLVIVDCRVEEVRERIEPVGKWVYGDYTLQVDGQTHKVGVQAS